MQETRSPHQRQKMNFNAPPPMGLMEGMRLTVGITKYKVMRVRPNGNAVLKKVGIEKPPTRKKAPHPLVEKPTVGDILRTARSKNLSNKDLENLRKTLKQ